MSAPNTELTSLTKSLTDGNPDGAVEGASVVSLSDAAATLLASQMVNKAVVVMTPSAARALTLDTVANLAAVLGDLMIPGTSFTFSVISLAAFAVTVTTAAGWTLVGSMAANNSSATFRVVITGSGTATCYRI